MFIAINRGKATIISHEITSIQFKKTRFCFFKSTPKYYLKYTSKDNKTYTISNPKKDFLDSIFCSCLYIPNYKIKYLKKAFKHISMSLQNGKKTLFFDHFIENGKITYIRVSHLPFVGKNMLYFAKNDKKCWVPLIKEANEKVSFLELIKFN